MVTDLCVALFWGCVVLTSPPLQPVQQEPAALQNPPTSARDLYDQAAKAISSGSTESAIAPLRELLESHPDSLLSELASSTLIECLLIKGDAEPALQVAENWLVRVACSPKAQEVAPGAAGRFEALSSRVFQQLLSQTRDPEKLANYLRTVAAKRATQSNENTESKSLLDSHLANAWQTLAKEWQQREQFDDAQAALLQAKQFATSDLSLERQIAFSLPLTRAHWLREHGRPADAIDVLRAMQTDTSSIEENAAIQFELAMALEAAGRYEETLQTLGRIAGLTESNPADTSSSNQSQINTKPAAWQGTALLRYAELLLRLKRIDLAIEALQSARTKFVDFEHPHEFDFLLARCFIAKVDFAQADRHLRIILDDSGTATTAARCRARWMCGELLFLQRQYSDAIREYDQVVGVESQPEWSARGLLQSAKCYELLGDPNSALQRYKNLNDLYPASTASTEARQRVAILSTTTAIR